MAIATYYIQAIKYYLHVGTLLCFIIFPIIGCAAQQKEFRAFIDNNTEWKLVESCGYEGCYPKVDFLTYKDIALRIEFDTIDHKYNVVRIIFESGANSLTFSPYKIYTEVNGIQVINKVLYSSNPNRKSDYLSSEQGLSDDHAISGAKGYLIILNFPVTQKEVVTIKLNNALRLNGKQLNLPAINFKRVSSGSGNDGR